MTSTNGLTNPFENAILNSNLTQLEKEKQIANYNEAISLGYEPPAEVLEEIVALIALGVLSPVTADRLQVLQDQVLAEIGPVITSNDGGDSAILMLVEGTSLVTTVTAEDRYSLNGTDSLTYSIVGGADAALFSISATGELTFDAPPDYEAPLGGDNVYDVIIQVNDGATLMDTQTLQITIADLNDTAPVITSAASVTIDENTTAVTTVTSTDADTVGTVTYAISGGADELLFSINAATGTLSFVDAPDFEALGSAAGTNVYDVQVTASDGIQSVVQSLSVSVADVDENVLPATFGVTFNGISAGDSSGRSISSAGDVNGDGFDDILIGAYYAHPNNSYAGESYVVFGSAEPFAANIELSSLDGSNGFVLNGIDEDDNSGVSVSSAGDVNGDGFDDILIGATSAGPNGRSSGESYVVFGSAAPFAASFELSSIDGSNGFVLNGEGAFDYSGWSVSSAGDVNGDGFDDILIAAPGSGNAGETYVIFGSGAPFAASFELSSLDGSNGFVAVGSDSRSVSSAGDVNGDGFDDILIGSEFVRSNDIIHSGESYVVFGSDAPFAASIELSSLNGSTGFVLNGIDAYDNSGHSVSSAGDVNGDGFDDILIGALNADPNGTNSGESYVVFGSNAPLAAGVDLSSLNGSNGFVLNGNGAYSNSGGSVSSAGDVNGDGFDDILIGASGSGNAGESYIVFGNDVAFAASIELSSLDGTDGFVFNGIDAVDLSGYSVSSAGDVNGDGFDDILIGAYRADPNGANSGETYLVYGGPDTLSAFDAADGVPDGAIQLSNLALAPDDFIV